MLFSHKTHYALVSSCQLYDIAIKLAKPIGQPRCL